MCKAGRSDCNASVGTDTDGCECATPSCCGTSCAIEHQDGVGDNFFNCSPNPTTSLTEAVDACVAYEVANGISQAEASMDCIDGQSCPQSPNNLSVCFSTNGGQSDLGSYCWEYSGTNAGKVVSNSCPESAVAAYN
jgi:hypothetical protein